MADPLPRAGLVLWPFLLAGCGLFSSPAGAHGIKLHVHVAGDAISGHADFVAGGPVTAARVTVYAPSGRRLGSAKTDDEGRFRFTPRERIDHRFWLEGDPGHGAEAVIPADELPASLVPETEPRPPAATGDYTAAIEQAVSRQVGPLREDIDRLRTTIRLHDLLGGIGYIAGITGLWFYLKARRIRRT